MMLRKKSKPNPVVANGGSGGDDGSKSKSFGVVSRKPFSDFSNLNLIPTDVLRKLCSNSISATDAQTILSKYQTPGIQFQGVSNSSKSDTSIGSSNFNTVAKRNGRTQLPRSSPSSVKNDEDCELVMLGEKKNVTNLEKSDKVSSDKGKSVCMPMRTTRASHVKNKQKEATLALDSTFSEDKHIVSPSSVKHVVSPSSVKHVISPSSVKPVQKMNDKAEVSLSEKTKDKGKATVISHGSGSYDKTKDKGKAVAMPWSSLSEQTVDKGKPKLLKDSFIAAARYTPVQKLDQLADVAAGSSKVYLCEKSKETAVSFSAGTYDKTKDKGKAVATTSSSLSEQAVDKGPKLLKDSFTAAARYTPVQKLDQLADVAAGSSKVNLCEKLKATAVSFSAGTHDKTKDKGKAVATPSSSLSEQAGDKGKPKLLKDSFLAALSSTPVQTRNQKANATAGSSKGDLSEKSKASVVSFSAGTYDKTQDKGKAVATSSSSLSKHEKGEGFSSETLEQKNSRGGVVSASSCPPVRRKRNTRDDLSEDGDTRSRAWTDPHPKLKKVKCENSFPEEFIKLQKAYFQEVDDFELEVEEV